MSTHQAEYLDKGFWDKVLSFGKLAHFYSSILYRFLRFSSFHDTAREQQCQQAESRLSRGKRA